MKSHRRSDSSTSDITAYGDSIAKPPNGKSTPLSSPMILQHPTLLSSPQTISTGLNSAMSSPKKLLTPIKRMFGHHSRSNTNIVSANDSLNSAVYGEFVPPMGRKNFSRASSSFLNFSDIHLEATAGKSKPDTIITKLTDSADPKWVQLGNLSDSSFDFQGTQRGEGISNRKLLLPVSHGGSKLVSTPSNISIAKSENNFLAKVVLPQDITANSTQHDDHSDVGSVNSNSSSQFSFVKDIRGGRNTSVKYYKTKSSKANIRALEKQSALGDTDMAYEDGALSDYDFENNGCGYDEDDEGFDDFEGDDKYNDFLQDNQSDIGLGLTGADFDRKLYSSSPLDSIDLDIPFSAVSPTESNYQSELLDAYLGDASSKLPISDSFPQSLFAIKSDSGEINPGSPLVSGITFGTEHKIKSSRKSTRSNALLRSKNDKENAPVKEHTNDPTKDETSKSNRNSINNMMDMLCVLEDTKNDHVETSKTNRKSINDMMDMLNALEDSTNSSDEKKISKTNRKSINNMMDMLSALEDDNKELLKEKNIKMVGSIQGIKLILNDIKEKPEGEIKRSSIRNLISNMMDSLANLEGSFGSEQNNLSNDTQSLNLAGGSTKLKFKIYSEDLSGTNTLTEKSTFASNKCSRSVADIYQREEIVDLTDIPGNALEEDLLDEVNMLPEDYDDDDRIEAEDLPQFFRSNSYNKKPKKVLMDNTFQKNKIETSSKTVTFYNKNNSLQTELSNSRSTSRVGSFKSVTSGTSIAEEDVSSKEPTRAKGHIPHSIYASSQFSSNSNDSIGYRSFNLEPITEFNSPNL